MQNTLTHCLGLGKALCQSCHMLKRNMCCKGVGLGHASAPGMVAGSKAALAQQDALFLPRVQLPEDCVTVTVSRGTGLSQDSVEQSCPLHKLLC